MNQKTAFFSWVVKHPFATVAVVCLAVGLSIVLLPRASFDPSPERIYPPDSDSALNSAGHRDRFGGDDDLMIVLREGDPFDEALETVAKAAEETDGITAVTTPARFEVAHSESDGSIVNRPLKAGETHPLLTGNLISPSGNAGAITFRIQPEHNDHNGRSKIYATLKEATQTVGGTWHFAGVPMIRLGYIQTMRSDWITIVPISVMLASIFFWFTFRDWRQALLGVLTITAATLISCGIFVATGSPLNLFTAVFLTIVVVVGTSDLVHLVHRYSDHHRRLGDQTMAAAAAAEEVGRACLWTSMTTALGFVVLLTTTIPQVRQFGWFTAMGVLITFVVTFLVAPPILARIKPPAMGAQNHTHHGSHRMARMGTWVLAHKRGLLAGWVVLTILFIVAAFGVKTDLRILEDVVSMDEFGSDLQFMDTHMGGVLPLEIAVVLPDEGSNPETMQAIIGFTDWMRQQPGIGYALALPDVISQAWGQLGGQTRLPPSQPALAQTLLTLELTQPQTIETFRFIETDGTSHSRIVARVQDIGSIPTMTLVEGIRHQAKLVLDPIGAHAIVTGMAYLIQEVNLTLVRQFSESFGLALAIIAMITLMGTRSIRRTVLVLIPNIMPLLMVLAVMGVTSITLKPSTAMVMSIGLGIAVDDTIHFINAYQRAAKHTASRDDALIHAYATAGRSMFDTSVMFAVGFSALILSVSPQNREFGLLTVCVVAGAVICDLFLLGPLLSWLDKTDDLTA